MAQALRVRREASAAEDAVHDSCRSLTCPRCWEFRYTRSIAGATEGRARSAIGLGDM